MNMWKNIPESIRVACLEASPGFKRLQERLIIQKNINETIALYNAHRDSRDPRGILSKGARHTAGLKGSPQIALDFRTWALVKSMDMMNRQLAELRRS